MDLSVLMAGSGFPRLRSSVTLLRSEGVRLLVDTGLAQDRRQLAAALAGRGLGPKDIDLVVSTHLHYDHCGNHLLCPQATYLVSGEDYEDTRTFMASYHADLTPDKSETAAILRSRNRLIKDFYVRSIVREVTHNLDFYDCVLAGDPRFLLIDEHRWLTKDVEVFPTPGHTRGHLSVVAHRAQIDGRGTPLEVLMAGDALVTAESLAPDGDREIHLAADPEQYRRTRRALLERYRRIVPGHGGLVERAVTGGGAEARAS